MLGVIIKGVAKVTSVANLDLGVPSSELSPGGGGAEGQAFRKRLDGLTEDATARRLRAILNFILNIILVAGGGVSVSCG